MRLDVRGEYPPDWTEISRQVKAAAHYRCVRCHHPFDANGGPLVCVPECDATRGRINHGLIELTDHYPTDGGMRTTSKMYADSLAIAGPHAPRIPGLNYGVHHLDGDKGNCRWWNLIPLCNSCHLTIQAKVIPERPYIWDHSDWFVPYVCGFYAFWFAHEEITRAEAEARPDHWLSLGQPWREVVRA